MAATKAPGRNVAEGERHTMRVNLRLDPETMTDLRDLAAEADCSIAQVIDAAMTALFRANMDLADAKGKDVYAAFIAQIEGE